MTSSSQSQSRDSESVSQSVNQSTSQSVLCWAVVCKVVTITMMLLAAVGWWVICGVRKDVQQRWRGFSFGFFFLTRTIIRFKNRLVGWCLSQQLICNNGFLAHEHSAKGGQLLDLKDALYSARFC